MLLRRCHYDDYAACAAVYFFFFFFDAHSISAQKVPMAIRTQRYRHETAYGNSRQYAFHCLYGQQSRVCVIAQHFSLAAASALMRHAIFAAIITLMPLFLRFRG